MGRLEPADGFRNRPGPSRSISTFNQLVRLLCIANEYIRNTSSTDDQGLRISNTLAKIYQWAAALPTHCSLKPATAHQNATILPHQLNLHMSLSICLTLLVTQSDRKLNLDKYSELLQVPHKVPEQLGTFSSAVGANFFPSAVYMFVGSVLESDRAYQWQGGKRMAWDGSLHQLCSKIKEIWNGAGLSTTETHIHRLPAESLNSTRIGTRRRQQSSLGDAPLVANPGTANKPNSYSFNSNGGTAAVREDSQMVDQTSQQPNIKSNNMDSLMSISHRNWGVSSISNATLAPPGDSMSIQENIEGESLWITKDSSTYSAATDLFHFAQSNQANQMPVMGQVDVNQIDSLQNTLSVPDIMPGVIDGLPVDPALQNMAGTDDLFFELSSLDNLYVLPLA